MPHDGEPVDTAAFEIRQMKKAIGLSLPLFLRLLGIKNLESRSDIDAVAERLLGMGL